MSDAIRPKDVFPDHHKGLATLYAIAEAINRPLDLQDLLEHALERVIEVTGADGGGIRLIDTSKDELILAAHRGLTEAYVRYASCFPLSEEIVGWVARSREPTISYDMWVDERVTTKVRDLLQNVGHRSLAQIPLIAQEQLVGTLGITAQKPNFFHLGDLELLNAIGQQLGIAIANAQLFEAARSRAKRLAALNTVASVVNQPSPLQNIMDKAIAKVVEVMETDGGGIRILDQKTGELPIVSSYGLTADHIQAVRGRQLGDGIVGEVAKTGKPKVVKNVSHDPRAISQEILQKEGYNTFAVVPLRVKDTIVGTLGVVTRQHRDFATEDIELLTAIGDQIGVAIENARLYTNLSQRARELEAINQVSAAVNRPGHLDQILEEGLKQTLTVMELEMGAIGLKNAENNSILLHSHHGMPPEFVEVHKERLRNIQFTPWPEDFEIMPQIVAIDPESEETPAHIKGAGIRQTVNVPLFAEGELVGALNLATHRIQPFNVEEQSLLMAIGYQLGTAIANARLRQEAIEAERLAVVGRLAAGVAHDLRSPLGGILRSAEFLTRPEISKDTRDKLSHAIVSLARRLISTSQGILDYIRGEEIKLQLAPIDLSDFLDEMLDVLQIDFSDRGIEVIRDYDIHAEVVMDADRMSQVVYNLAENARDAMPRGGKFTVRTRAANEQVELRFTDSGPGVPSELYDRIFEPFFTYGKFHGAGLGLTIAQQIVEEHGGTIHLQSETGKGTTFIVSLPV